MKRMCDECGKKLPVKAHSRQRYCDKECQRAKFKGVCSVCGGPRSNQPWSGSLPEGRGRCQSCRQAARQAEEERIKAARTKPCKSCGEIFTAENGNAQFCGDECRVEGYRRHRRHHGRKPYTLSSTQRGYGSEHKKARRQRLAELIPGAPCPLCLEPMFAGQELDLDHSDPASRWRGEPGDRLTHAVCNRREGARHARSGRGCDCEACTGEYAMFVGQRCRRLLPVVSSRPKRERVIPPPVPICVKDCVVCGTLFTAHGKFAERRKSCGAHTSSEVAAARYRNEPGFREKAIENALARYHGDPEYRAKTIGRAKQQRHRDKDVPAYIRYHGDAVDSKQRVLQHI